MRAISTPLAVSASSICGVKCRPAVGAATEPRSLREDSLVALAIRSYIVTANVGRQRHVADAVEDGEEIVDRFEAQQTLAELAAFENFSLKLDSAVGRGKDQELADGDFSARPDQGAP